MPTQFQDLNPIEHVWGHLKNHLAAHRFTSIPQLRLKIVEEFEKIYKSYLNKLIESMPRRFKAVIKSEGGISSIELNVIYLYYCSLILDFTYPVDLIFIPLRKLKLSIRTFFFPILYIYHIYSKKL